MYILRGYQREAVTAGLKIAESGKNGILVLPTASGKSLVIAEIIRQSQRKTIVLQPTKEILEQNLEKIRAFGMDDIGIFSASMGEKTVGKITIATIGSIIKHKERFQRFELIIVDECDLVNSKSGQYEAFISTLGLPVIGTTATPYRMRHYLNTFGNNEPVVESRFLTRTRPRIFQEISHITQIPDMFLEGFLCPIQYDIAGDYDSQEIKSNSTGQGYNEESLLSYNKSKGIVPKIVATVLNSPAKYKLIFTQFREESQAVIEHLAGHGVKCAEVAGATKKKDREKILREFRDGGLCVVNVGTLVAGYDFPELDHIIFARPTKSLRLYSQICGRGLRIAEGKKQCIITDLCDNIKRFGEINSFIIEDPAGRGLWRLKSDKGYLTGVNILNGRDLEKKRTARKEKNQIANGTLEIPFGKYRGTKLSDIKTDYLKWGAKTFDPGKWRNIFQGEIRRREYL